MNVKDMPMFRPYFRQDQKKIWNELKERMRKEDVENGRAVHKIDDCECLDRMFLKAYPDLAENEIMKRL